MTFKPLSRILVVDDDADILIVAKYSLEKKEGLLVKCVSSGKEALKEAPLFHPDIILLDLLMPEMDGIATLKEFKRNPSLASIPIVFLTAMKIQEEKKREYMTLGAAATIPKPFEALELAGLVQSIYERL